MSFISIGTYALLGGIVALLFIVPLASIVPLRMQRQLRNYLAEVEGIQIAEVNRENYEFSLPQKLSIVACAVILCACLVWARGISNDTAALGSLLMGLLLLAAINAKHTLLPDEIVYPLLWLGLLYHAFLGDCTKQIFGAVVAYSVPFVLLCLGKWKMRKELMGHGDLKTFALVGAWLGLEAIPFIFANFLLAIIATSVIWAVLARRMSLSIVPTGCAHLLAASLYIFGVRVV